MIIIEILIGYMLVGIFCRIINLGLEGPDGKLIRGILIIFSWPLIFIVGLMELSEELLEEYTRVKAEIKSNYKTIRAGRIIKAREKLQIKLEKLNEKL